VVTLVAVPAIVLGLGLMFSLGFHVGKGVNNSTQGSLPTGAESWSSGPADPHLA
jgi:hypothetical protein